MSYDTFPRSLPGWALGLPVPPMDEQTAKALEAEVAHHKATIDPEPVGRCGYEILGPVEDGTIDEHYHQGLKIAGMEGISALLEGQASQLETKTNIETDIASLLENVDELMEDFDDEHNRTQQHNEQTSKALSDLRQQLVASISTMQEAATKATKVARSTEENCSKIAKEIKLYQHIASWLETRLKDTNLQMALSQPGLSEGVLLRVLQAQSTPLVEKLTARFQKQLDAQEKRHTEELGKLRAELLTRDDAIQQALNELLSRQSSQGGA